LAATSPIRPGGMARTDENQIEIVPAVRIFAAADSVSGDYPVTNSGRSVAR